MLPYAHNDNIKDIKFVSWVPTTLTSISFDFIGDSSNLDINKSFVCKKNTNEKKAYIINFNPPLSDKFEIAIQKVFFPSTDELKPVTYVSIQENPDQTFSGNTQLLFLDYVTYKEGLKNKVNNSEQCDDQEVLSYFKTNLRKIIIKASIDFIVKKDGEISLNKLNIMGNFTSKSDYENKKMNPTYIKDGPYVLQRKYSDTEIDFIVQALYTFTKRALHTDIHHHEKIDVIIPIQRKTSIDTQEICESMGKYMKIIEKEKVNSIDIEIDRYTRASGIYAYVESFQNKFIKDANKCSYCSQIKNIVNSIKAKDEKDKDKRAKTVKFFTDTLTNWKYLLTLIPGTFILFFAMLNFFIVGNHNLFKQNEINKIYASPFMTEIKLCIIRFMDNPWDSDLLLFIVALYIVIFSSSLIKIIVLKLIKWIGYDRLKVVNQINFHNIVYLLVIFSIASIIGYFALII